MQNTHQKRNFAKRLKQLIRDFGDESGATTVEFVLWVPVFMLILMLTVDVSLLFLRQSNMWQVARDTARQVSIGQLTTKAKAEEYAELKGTFGGDTPAADVEIDTTYRWVRVNISVPMREVGVFGIFKVGGRVITIGGTGNLVASVTHRLEPDVEFP